MKQVLLFLLFLIVASTILPAQNRGIARGATPGELYIYSKWYETYYPGTPYMINSYSALYHITENGKKTHHTR
jgi:hypothetical protein